MIGNAENLQTLFQDFFFNFLQQHAEEEEIPVPDLQYYDNKPAVDQLMSKPDGLMYLLDEASKQNESTYLIGKKNVFQPFFFNNIKFFFKKKYA